MGSLGWCLRGPDGRLHATTFRATRRDALSDDAWSLLRSYEPSSRVAGRPQTYREGWRLAQRDGWQVVRVRLMEIGGAK